MSFKDLQHYIKELELRQDLKRVTAPADPVYEITEIADRMVKNGGPALLFENVKGSSYPVAINLFGTLERTCFAFGVQNFDEIGDRIAESVVAFFEDGGNLKIIYKLKEAGLNFESEKKELSDNILNGAKIVISGSFSRYSRDELKEMIEKFGGKNTSSVSKSTDYFLAGEKVGPSKLQKVEQFGIKMITEDEFINLIGINP